MRDHFLTRMSAILLTGCVLQAQAGVSSTNMQVSATVLSSCAMSTLPLMFKDYDPLSSKPTEAESLLTVRCSSQIPYKILMNAGVNAADKPYDYNAQAMTGEDPSQKLYYNLFTNPTYTTLWGDGATNGSFTVSGIGNGQLTTIPIYGRILAGQNAAHGKYLDTVTITIIY